MQTIVSIISGQLTPNYVFIKEKANPCDNLVFITTQKMKNQMEKIESILKSDKKHFKFIEIVFDEKEDENNYISLSEQLKDKLSQLPNPNDEFLVNLTGGTKLMSIATKEIMSMLYPKVSYYYIPYPNNTIVNLYNNNKSGNLKYRISPKEYLSFFSINESDYTSSKPIVSKAFTNNFFNKFQTFSTEDINIIIALLDYRGLKRKSLNLNEIENQGQYNRCAIKGIKQFIVKTGLDCPNNELSCSQIDYLTGGWFEEYTYNLIKTEFNLNESDIFLNLNIKDTDNNAPNELDVVFTLGNKLLTIECKTGIDKQGILNNIFYKAIALNDSRLGKLGAKTYIFSLEKENLDYNKTANKMQIKYFDQSYFYDKDKLQKIFADIRNYAKN